MRLIYIGGGNIDFFDWTTPRKKGWRCRRGWHKWAVPYIRGGEFGGGSYTSYEETRCIRCHTLMEEK